MIFQITGITSRSTIFSNYDPEGLGLLVSTVLPYAILAAGLFFFVRLISAGYSYLTSAGDSSKVQSASKELANAAVGLVIVIISFFIAQALEVIFGIKFL